MLQLPDITMIFCKERFHGDVLQAAKENKMVLSFLHSITISLAFSNIDTYMYLQFRYYTVYCCYRLLVLVLMSCARVDLIVLITKIESYMA